MVLQGLLSLKDFMLLLSLFIFIFSILGMQIFGGYSHFGAYRSSFDSLWKSSYTVFEILTGSNWHVMMFEGMLARGKLASLYFAAWIVIGNFVLLTLFLAILITNFQVSKQHACYTLHAYPNSQFCGLLCSSCSDK